MMVSIYFTESEWNILSYIALNPTEYVQNSVKLIPDIIPFVSESPTSGFKEVQLNCTEEQKNWVYDLIKKRLDSDSIPKVIDKTAAQLEAENRPTFEVLKNNARLSVMSMHSLMLYDLTGQATVEERDTWQIKYTAAENFLNKLATETEKEMLNIEASLREIQTEELANIVCNKALLYSKLIGVAAGLRSKSLKMIDSCTTETELTNAISLISLEFSKNKEQFSKSNGS